jgi:hypothetical protein
MDKLRKLHQYISKNNGQCRFRAVVNVERECLYLLDNCGNKIFYNEEEEEYTVKCRVKCIKDDNVITYLPNPIIMDLKAKTKRDVLSIVNSRI